ncbi:TPA: hypothetical protein I7676_02205 [Vibrio vulnificus]|nr:hypothetical protein [Vibrio vulnificus]HAS8216174.1 hypothetical protein [Vibrio vulnificus]HAS8296167.1 hypothetical protein [Vibrio vulnificus]
MKGAGSKFGYGLNSRHFAIEKVIYLKLSTNTKWGKTKLPRQTHFPTEQPSLASLLKLAYYAKYPIAL